MIEMGNSVLAQARHAIGLAKEYLTTDAGDHGKNIDRAIKLVEDAFIMLDEKEHNRMWVELATNLGIFYLTKYRGDKCRNGEKALAYFELVEKYYGSDYRWAKLQESKARAYLMQGHANVDRALSLFELSLGVIQKLEYPGYWVMLQINMAKAYSLKEGLENRKKAHEHIAEAKRTLREYKLPDADYHYAWIDKIAGDLHMRGSGRQNLLLAIARYQKAIGIFPKEVFPAEHDEVLKSLDEARRMSSGDHPFEYRI